MMKFKRNNAKISRKTMELMNEMNGLGSFKKSKISIYQSLPRPGPLVDISNAKPTKENIDELNKLIEKGLIIDESYENPEEYKHQLNMDKKND